MTSTGFNDAALGPFQAIDLKDRRLLTTADARAVAGRALESSIQTDATNASLGFLDSITSAEPDRTSTSLLS